MLPCEKERLAPPSGNVAPCCGAIRIVYGRHDILVVSMELYMLICWAYIAN